MRRSFRKLDRSALAAVVLLSLAALALPAGAFAAPTRGTLTQLPGSAGCLVDRSAPSGSCRVTRALKGPGPFMGSRAIAVSPDGKNVYVAASKSNAIAVFERNARSGRLVQPRGAAGCVAAEGASGCAAAAGLEGPNSVAVSPDGRSVYATSRTSNSLAVFSRDPKTGSLTQLSAGFGCISGLPIPLCASGRALVGPDVVVVSPDGKNVYVGSFFGNAIAVFNRDPASGALAQAGGSAGCIAEAISGCAVGIALGAVEGLAATSTGVYAGSALSNAVAVLARDPTTGTLAQATDGSGCIVDSPLSGCTTGFEVKGANAVAVSPGGKDVYVTSLFSNSVTSFTRAIPAGGLTQKAAPAGCLVWLRAVGCSFGQALSAPEGLAVSPDGANVYVAAFATGAIVVLARNKSGEVTQMEGRAGCLAPKSVPGCTRAGALRGVSSVALSPDGRNLYSTSFASNAVDIFRRNK
ncbi:MAG TPA: beta-propeller fold lactonase family protein [Solirubrobacterales bacterium]